MLVLCLFSLTGCGKKADESAPISEVKAQAEKMDVDQLRQMAIKYKDALVAKEDEVKKVAEKLKDIPIAEKLGAEAKEITAEIGKLKDSADALKERFDIYYNAIKAKGGDLSGL